MLSRPRAGKTGCGCPVINAARPLDPTPEKKGDRCCWCYLFIGEGTVGVVERLGRFEKLLRPGLNKIGCFFERVAGRLDSRVNQIEITCTSSTADRVSVQFKVAVLIQPHLNHRSGDGRPTAFYGIENLSGTLDSYVSDGFRSQGAKYKVDELYYSTTAVAEAVKAQIADRVAAIGWTVVDLLVLDLRCDSRVFHAMQQVRIAQLNRRRDLEISELRKAYEVKKAEGDATAQYWQGQGMSNQRKAIVAGFQSQNQILGKGLKGFTPMHVQRLMEFTSYTSNFKDMSVGGKKSTIIMSHDPREVTGIVARLRSFMGIGPDLGVNEEIEGEELYADLLMAPLQAPAAVQMTAPVPQEDMGTSRDSDELASFPVAVPLPTPPTAEAPLGGGGGAEGDRDPLLPPP